MLNFLLLVFYLRILKCEQQYVLIHAILNEIRLLRNVLLQIIIDYML